MVADYSGLRLFGKLNRCHDGAVRLDYMTTDHWTTGKGDNRTVGQ